MDIPTFLLGLRSRFRAEGHDLRFVGGCVRDMVLNMLPKDIDMCTDATPETQIKIYSKANIRYVPTGIVHGTITVVDPTTNVSYEITSLRVEHNHDGRHATVSFTDDWEADLGRRDLTMNSMAMDFDGNLHDPFGGELDLLRGIIRFVGDPAARIQEDYLRILRYFRFLGRYGFRHLTGIDEETVDALSIHRRGLRYISVERVWSEMSRILSGRNGYYSILLMEALGITREISMTPPRDMMQRIEGKTNDPITSLVACQGVNAIELATTWKMSRAEADQIRFLVSYINVDVIDYRYMLAIDNIPLEWVEQIAVLREDKILADSIQGWTIPVFPISGHDLLDLGFERGPHVGLTLRGLREEWARTDYRLTRADLLSDLSASAAS